MSNEVLSKDLGENPIRQNILYKNKKTKDRPKHYNYNHCRSLYFFLHKAFTWKQ